MPAHCQALLPLSPLSSVTLTPTVPEQAGTVTLVAICKWSSSEGRRRRTKAISMATPSSYSHHFPHNKQFSEGMSSWLLGPTNSQHPLSTPPVLCPSPTPCMALGQSKPGQDQQGPEPVQSPLSAPHILNQLSPSWASCLSPLSHPIDSDITISISLLFHLLRRHHRALSGHAPHSTSHSPPPQTSSPAPPSTSGHISVNTDEGHHLCCQPRTFPAGLNTSLCSSEQTTPHQLPKH